MIPGFKTRLLQEMRYLMQEMKEFEEIRCVGEHLVMNETCFPPNCMAWAGASVIS